MCTIKVVYTNADCLTHQKFLEIITPSLDRLEALGVLLTSVIHKPKCRLQPFETNDNYESTCAVLSLGLMPLEKADALYQLMNDFVKLDKQMIPNASVEYCLDQTGGDSS